MERKTIGAWHDRDIFELLLNAVQKIPPIPSSVYRLQLNPSFDFSKATEVLGYLQSLGIKAIYTSPYFKATPGSLHGYDVTDPTQLNPDLGSTEDYEAFVTEIQKRKMGHVLDVVPNHMGIGGNANDMWMDVLENGPSSIFSHYFDIDWDPEKRELKNKVLIPILGNHYGATLENQEIRLVFEPAEGLFYIQYWEHRLPVAPRSYAMILRHRLEKLEKEMGQKNKRFSEFLHAVTIFEQLPPRSEKDVTRILERNHEKEEAKKRLAEVVTNSTVIEKFIATNVEIFNGEQGNTKSFDLLDELLAQQAYRMAYWRVAAEEINYRRFFDVNELAAIRIEDSLVFQSYHQLIFRLVREGKVTGVRIDHPDGLYDPPSYFKKLQLQRLLQLLIAEWTSDQGARKAFDDETQEAFYFQLERLMRRKEFQNLRPLYIVVEKILEKKEVLPSDWQVHGTVGYDYLNASNGIFVDWEQADVFDEIYEKYTGQKFDFENETYERKKYVALVHMSSEVNHLAKRLGRLSEKNRRYRDFTLNNITVALRETIACFPVYRTYITPHATRVSKRDQKYINIAIEKAKSKTAALPHTLYDFIRDVLLLSPDEKLSRMDRHLYRDFVLRFQQLTGPIMAKGIEDTAFYVYNRLISLNEVGGDPTYFGNTVSAFHRSNARRSKDWPYSFITTSTHDTKRSEDVRMRIHALSEIPLEWQSELVKWSSVNEKYKALVGEHWAPDRNTEYFIYQTLLGTWPCQPLFGQERYDYIERIWLCIEKSIREAKVYTNWVNPNEEYEKGVKKFLFEILTPEEDNHFLSLFLPFQKHIATCGMLNSISSLVLKVGAPGVLDIYQGTDLWDDSLVDPDNRRPVDFAKRTKMIEEIQKESQTTTDLLKLVEGWLDSKENGKIKLYLLWKGLNFREKNRDLVLQGEYLPLKVTGKRERNTVAFMRKHEDMVSVSVVGRYFNELHDEESLQKKVWKDAQILIPEKIAAEELVDVFTGRTVKVKHEDEGCSIDLTGFFGKVTFALFTNKEKV